MPEVRKERTGWRDEAMSIRHREYGYDCPAVDIDFLMLEYDNGNPVAIIEYKNERAAPVDLGHPSYKALKRLADLSNIHFFLVRYASDFSWWTITPVNSSSFSVSKIKTSLTVDEVRYVRFLYYLRGRELPNDIKEKVEGLWQHNGI